MKKRVIILMVLILGIMVVGCSKAETNGQSEGISQEYKDSMSKGKSNVIEEEYDKAIDYFKLALESKKDDTEAKNLIKQLNLLVEAKDSEEHGAYFFQIEKIDRINDIKTQTDVVKDKANDYKEVVLKNIDESIDYLEAAINEGKYKSAQKDIKDVIEECKKSDSLNEQLDRCNDLLKTYKEKQKKAEEQANKEAEQKQQISNNSNKTAKKSSSKNKTTFTRKDAKRIAENEFDVPCYDDDPTANDVFVLSDNPDYDESGNKYYRCGLYGYIEGGTMHLGDFRVYSYGVE